jgi:hypothetical protein
MTICGFAKTRDGSAFVWADGEAYRDSEPLSAKVVKLGVSPSGLCGISTGYFDLSERFRKTIEGFGAQFDFAVRRLPETLRFARAWKVKRCRELEISYESPTNYAVAGWSGDTVRGAVFYESRDFEAVEADAWFSPSIEAEPQNAEDVLATAQRQLKVVQRSIPAATGRDLTVAKIGPTGVAVAVVPLLIKGSNDLL